MYNIGDKDAYYDNKDSNFRPTYFCLTGLLDLRQGVLVNSIVRRPCASRNFIRFLCLPQAMGLCLKSHLRFFKSQLFGEVESP